MDQARRDRYLAALGIVRYRPRPPPDVLAAPGSEAPVVAPAASAAPVPRPALLDPLAPSAQAHPVPPPVAGGAGAAPLSDATSVPAPPAVESEDLLHVRLACWQPAPDLMVLDALPPGGRPDRGQLTLLANILRAIGRLEGPLPVVEYIDWPLLPGGDASMSGAREAVALFLAGRRAAAPFAWLVAMGEPAWRCLSSAAGAGEQIAVGGAQAILVPGLGEMLADPGLKAVTWKAIRALAAAPL